MLDFKLEFNLWTLKAGRAGHDAKTYLRQSQMFRASGYSARNSAQTTLYLQYHGLIFDCEMRGDSASGFTYSFR